MSAHYADAQLRDSQPFVLKQHSSSCSVSSPDWLAAIMKATEGTGKQRRLVQIPPHPTLRLRAAPSPSGYSWSSAAWAGKVDSVLFQGLFLKVPSKLDG